MCHLDEVAHEEALRFGACTPFEKTLIRKMGRAFRCWWRRPF